jgi:hypothetical protein
MKASFLFLTLFLLTFFGNSSATCPPSSLWLFGSAISYDSDLQGNIIAIVFRGENANETEITITLYFNETTGNTQADAQTIINATGKILLEYFWSIIEHTSYAIICDISV